MLAYANDQNGRYPPNVSATGSGQFWYDPDRIGQYLSGVTVSASTGVTGGVLVCPETLEHTFLRDEHLGKQRGQWHDGASLNQLCTRFQPSTSRNALVAKRRQLVGNDPCTETWSSKGSAAAGWYTPPTVGFAGLTPGQRFGGEGGVPPFSAGPWGRVNCELVYMRHRFGPHAGSFTSPTATFQLAMPMDTLH